MQSTIKPQTVIQCRAARAFRAIAIASSCGVMLVLASWAGVGCSQISPMPEPTVQERIRGDGVAGLRLAPQLESRLMLKNDPEVVRYLTKLAGELIEASPELHGSDVSVTLMTDRRRRWESFSLPGVRIYVSIGLAHAATFETEMAAVLALELGHIQRRTVSRQIERGQKGFFGPSGIFTFTDQDRLDAVGDAVQILYLAGFDPRGLVSLLTRMQENPARSTLDPGLVARMSVRARDEIARSSPLINPIVKGMEFARIRARLQKLL